MENAVARGETKGFLARVRVGNPQFSPISPTSRTHVRQYAEGQIPGTCTGERTRACAQGNRRCLTTMTSRPARVRVAVPPGE